MTGMGLFGKQSRRVLERLPGGFLQAAAAIAAKQLEAPVNSCIVAQLSVFQPR